MPKLTTVLALLLLTAPALAAFAQASGAPHWIPAGASVDLIVAGPADESQMVSFVFGGSPDIRIHRLIDDMGIDQTLPPGSSPQRATQFGFENPMPGRGTTWVIQVENAGDRDAPLHVQLRVQ